MKLEYKQLEEVIFGKTGFRRFTQDSSVLPDVWIAFGAEPNKQVDLLLTPMWGTAPGKISRIIDEKLAAERKTARWKSIQRPDGKLTENAYNTSTIALKLYFDEMIRVVLPLTNWWENNILQDKGENFSLVFKNETFRKNLIAALADSVEDSRQTSDGKKVWDINHALKHSVWKSKRPKHIEHLIWLIKIVGAIALEERAGKADDILEDVPAIFEAFINLMEGVKLQKSAEDRGLVWAINRNRGASAMIWQSTTAIKADAARRLFEVNCDGIRWAIIDSGIDAKHPAFRLRDEKGVPYEKPFIKKDGKTVNMTRIEKTYDFTRIRQILSRDQATFNSLPLSIRKHFDAGQRKALQDRLQQGRAIDWEFLAPLIEISNEKYKSPVFEHGTHVAGIIAADWRSTDKTNEKKMDLRGVCPDLRLYDLRVLDDDGLSDEFSVLAALQFIQYLNINSDYLQLHGVNLSLSIRHSVKNFACGCTPICEEAERLVNSGLVVVAAAGNDGYLEAEMSGNKFSEGYRSISITDPGNAQGVITVGATHRDSPHTYGISYFSSRGPTGDGRIKPDLVAPGEKITSAIPQNGLKTMDGTSMAAPHVSGAAALLMARYRELIGKPTRIKQILCETATDLGRERYFQGSGMVDILRAMQSV